MSATKEAPHGSSKKRGNQAQPAAQAADAANVMVWEDDPESGNPPITVAAPAMDGHTLAYAFPAPAPQVGQYQQGTPEFRYWVAAEALRRGADFWARHAEISAWQPGSTLSVILDEGEDLNAFYDRKALNFFHGPGAKPGQTVFSGESGDVLCHEMGHAILDTIKPQLWNAASHEAAAFHESFGDMSAILSAIQIPTLRQATLSETGGHVARNSRLSRLAEQLGNAIRAQVPDAVDPDCLRNAVNSFTYKDPIRLPSSAPASELSSEPHSFSRVFTGAFFEALAGFVTVQAGQGAPSEANLLAAADDMALILVAGIKRAPVVSNFYAQVAAGMVTASADRNAAYPEVLRSAFVKRAILSLHSASELHELHKSVAAVATSMAAERSEGLGMLALPAAHYGLDQPLLVEPASQHRSLTAQAFEFADDRMLEPASSSTAARAFVDDLFRQGQVDYGEHGVEGRRLRHGRRRPSHEIRADGGGLRLHRCLFDCGLSRR
ncbi:MAG: hypothetical protein JOZ05_23270 [Acetobacteraceae bacterium]|nr:hypothetical protein [Acetobacteraceae bacterium]